MADADRDVRAQRMLEHDLLVTRKGDVFVLLGDGQGAFPLEVDLPENSGDDFGAAAMDLDGDGFSELVVSYKDGDELIVYRSQGRGAFAAPQPYPTGDQPHHLVLADFGGGTSLDAAVGLKGSNAVAILMGDGAGGFLAATEFETGGNAPLALAAGVFGPGAALDVAVANYSGEQLAVLSSVGPGQLGLPALLELPGKPSSLSAADFNLDGHLDLATALDDLGLAAIAWGGGQGQLDPEPLTLSVGDGPVAVLAADFDQDGAADLLALNQDEDTVSLLFNDVDAPGSFAPEQILVPLGGLSEMSAVSTGDFNSDGVMDVVIAGDGVKLMLSKP